SEPYPQFLQRKSVRRYKRTRKNFMGTQSKIRIVIADDHFIVRMGLVALLNMEADLEVIGEAGNGKEAVEIFEKLKPDLALMDLCMPNKDGIQATTEIKRKFPDARI